MTDERKRRGAMKLSDMHKDTAKELLGCNQLALADILGCSKTKLSINRWLTPQDVKIVEGELAKRELADFKNEIAVSLEDLRGDFASINNSIFIAFNKLEQLAE
ncbi:MAG: hypothetical protein COB69_00335 [Phycisphaera sp.]|nr:MAG: hypothetical protein COB69_00335 [Phycisphaera sp.]